MVFTTGSIHIRYPLSKLKLGITISQKVMFVNNIINKSWQVETVRVEIGRMRKKVPHYYGTLNEFIFHLTLG